MNSMKTTKARQDDDADLMVGRIRQRQRIRSGSLRLCISAVLRWCLVLMVINDGVAAATASAPDGYDNAAPAIPASSAADVDSASLPQTRVGNEQRILSRKRRYLIFPEGSSLQLSKFRATCTICTILCTVSVCVAMCSQSCNCAIGKVMGSCH